MPRPDGGCKQLNEAAVSTYAMGKAMGLPSAKRFYAIPNNDILSKNPIAEDQNDQ
jgi:hypothetical protein